MIVSRRFEDFCVEGYISAVCRDIGSSDFDYAAPGAVVIKSTVAGFVSVKTILFICIRTQIYTHNSQSCYFLARYSQVCAGLRSFST